MVFDIYGKGEGYVNGKLVIADGKYKFTGEITIGPKGIERIDNGNWEMIKCSGEQESR